MKYFNLVVTVIIFLVACKPAVESTEQNNLTPDVQTISFTEEEDSNWYQQKVTLETINLVAIDSLFKNNTKLTLINFWATWCPPCIVEYPEFIKLYRFYEKRDFQFISISADKLAEKNKALTFLEKNHSAVPNYIYGRKKTTELANLINTTWNGELPYSILINSEGNVLKTQQGIIDPLAWQALIEEELER